MVDKFTKEYYTVNDLIEIMAILRSENGCPWDKEQDHKSIRQNFIEETYEVAEAIDNEDTELLKEELGDVLLQVVFHSQIENEKGVFSFDDVADGVCKKLIVRHPHIFSDVMATTADEVLNNWDRIKQQTKSQETFYDTLESIPSTLPALMKAQKVIKRASKANSGSKDLQGIINSFDSDFCKLKDKIGSDNDASANYFEDIGKMLLSLVQIAGKLKVDAENALEFSSKEFVLHFKKVEDLIRLEGKDITALSIDEFDAYWQRTKNNF